MPKWWCFRICGESPRGCGMVFDELFCWNMNRRSFDGDVFVAWWFPSFLSLLSYLGDHFFSGSAARILIFVQSLEGILRNHGEHTCLIPHPLICFCWSFFTDSNPWDSSAVFIWENMFGSLFPNIFSKSIIRTPFIQGVSRYHPSETPCILRPLARISKHRGNGNQTTEGWAFRKVSKLGAELILEGTGVRKPESFPGGGNSNIFYFHPGSLEKWSILTNIFEMGWNHQLVLFGQRHDGGIFFFFSFAGKQRKESRAEWNDGLVQDFCCQKKYMLFSNVLGQFYIVLSYHPNQWLWGICFSVGSTCFLWVFSGGHETSQILKRFVGQRCVEKVILGRPFIQWLKSAGGSRVQVGTW